MTNTEKPDIIFYQSLGELFYAVAAADRTVKPEEYDALLKMVMDEWKVYEDVKDYYDESVGYQMEFVFNWFDYEHMDAYDCFKNFSAYAKSHANLFTTEKKQLILKTAYKIANAFSGKNKSELIILKKLELLFKNITQV
ncbi:hypothetical protein [Lacinutrix sp. MedPE-SW]|uniref:hypothetical protein n=1 Tax=Lacinutrix sp. MedPE-SW TaxID=1860087 RepID=UPI00091F33CD|nr:hypothetical protein [Lacinutrix sp. MedPE-SW]OIQ18744.1 MAG: hypothetical protein BM549_11300 [Lacinutrix sp. MedPE-SW]